MSRQPQIDRQLQILDCGGLRWTLRPLSEDKLLNAVLKDPDSFLADPSLHFKNSRNVTVTRIPISGDDGWVLRRLNYGKRLHQLRDSLRPTRAHRAFANGLRLEQAGVPTASVLAAGEARRLGWPVRAYLLTKEISCAVTLQQLLQAHSSLPRKALASLAETLARLHNAGFSHRDLKAANVLFDKGNVAHLIDLDGVRRMRQSSHRQAVTDLARLAKDMLAAPAFSNDEWVVLLKSYCQHRQTNDWQWWADQISTILKSGR